MKNYTITVNGNVYDVTVEEGASTGAVAAPVKKAAPKAAPAAAAPAAPAAPEEIYSSGLLKLKNCDEKTAAMIMAIVADDSGIPLEELVFKSIKLVEKD